MTGLSRPQAEKQRERFGRNDIIEDGRRPWRDLLSDTARDPMIWFLVGTGLSTAAWAS